jgi:nascent polypeptide-associated complex subunit alpha
MFPGMGGLNPKKMQGMMKQLGISQEEIDASRVIIEKTDNTKIIIENPSVSKITMQGQDMIQIAGGEIHETQENPEPEFSQDDIITIVEKTGCTEPEAQKALEETGDLAEAIMKLSE